MIVSLKALFRAESTHCVGAEIPVKGTSKKAEGSVGQLLCKGTDECSL
jgi:hypothetical protein